MSKPKTELSPAELAARVRKNMEQSTSQVNLSELVDLDQFEQLLVSEIREHRVRSLTAAAASASKH